MEIERGRRSPPDDSFHESDAIFPQKLFKDEVIKKFIFDIPFRTLKFMRRKKIQFD